VRWLSVIREEDFGSVRSHRLIVSDVEKDLGELERNGYICTYPEDSDESSKEIPWDYTAYFIKKEQKQSRFRESSAERPVVHLKVWLVAWNEGIEGRSDGIKCSVVTQVES
jgi:hypothetical protein